MYVYVAEDRYQHWHHIPYASSHIIQNDDVDVQKQTRMLFRTNHMAPHINTDIFVFTMLPFSTINLVKQINNIHRITLLNEPNFRSAFISNKLLLSFW